MAHQKGTLKRLLNLPLVLFSEIFKGSIVLDHQLVLHSCRKFTVTELVFLARHAFDRLWLFLFVPF